MGATAIYALPWPELTDVANGPASFQALAESTEAALHKGACTLVTAVTKATTGAGENVTSTAKEFTMGPINLPADAHTVLITWSIALDFSVGGVFDQWATWDGTTLYRPVYNSYADGNTRDRTYTFTAAVKDQAAGDHTATLGLVSTGGASMWVKNLSYNVVALG